MVYAIFLGCGVRRRRPPVVSQVELIQGLVLHAVAQKGTLAGHVKELADKTITDGALAQWRAMLSSEIFDQFTKAALKPKGDPVPHPEAFYHGLRLCGVDGSLFSVTNAPQAKRQMRKARSRRGRAAFPKVGVAVMVELGLHIETLSTSSDVRLGQVQIACWLEKPPSLSQPGLGARVAKIMEMLGG